MTILSSIFKSFDNENKIVNPIWMLGQNNTRLTLYLGAESKYPQLLTLYMIYMVCLSIMHINMQYITLKFIANLHSSNFSQLNTENGVMPKNV